MMWPRPSHMANTSKTEDRARTDFTETQWTLVRTAGNKASPMAAAVALETLCKVYWLPIYAYVRRRGYSQHDAQDLTQDFFTRIISDNSFARADRNKGKFRSYLLGALNHFLSDEWDRTQAQKRGGGQILFSLNDAEEKYAQVPASDMTPEKMFDHRWGLILLERGLQRLQEEMKAAKKERPFRVLKPFLAGEPGSGYAAPARELGVSANRIAVMVFRLRQRFRELVRAELAQTVCSQADLDEELRHLFS
jgi:RNA polymerase sigma factor (sigma-70 family)